MGGRTKAQLIAENAQLKELRLRATRDLEQDNARLREERERLMGELCRLNALRNVSIRMTGDGGITLSPLAPGVELRIAVNREE